MEELKKFEVKSSFVLIKAGFFSEDNIKGLYAEETERCCAFLLPEADG